MRNIEQAARTEYSKRTFVRLEKALEWEPGTVDHVLDGAARNDDRVDGAFTGDDWRRLGKAVEARRFDLGCSQEQLVERSGPSHQTVRSIERGESASYRPLTFRKLDRSLDWPDGTSMKILQGAVSPDDLKTVTAQDGDDLADEELTADDRQRLAEAVSIRRAQLGRTQESAPVHGGPSGRTVRAIEQAQLPRYSSAVLAKLDRFLDWPPGTAVKILEGTVSPNDLKAVTAWDSAGIVDEEPTADDRQRLAEAVRGRRLALGLRQTDLAERGGPSTETLRLIENARQDGYGPRTLARLDRSLNWPPGTAAKILEGAEAELATVVTHNAPSRAEVSVDTTDKPQVLVATEMVSRLAVEKNRSPAKEAALQALLRLLPELVDE